MMGEILDQKHFCPPETQKSKTKHDCGARARVHAAARAAGTWML